MDIRITRARKVFSDGKHNAFTGIVAAHGKVFITFRSGSSHLTKDGAIKVIASTDMETWQVAAEVRHSGVDLRDPKAVLFGNELIVFFNEICKDKSKSPFAIKSKDGAVFSDPIQLQGVSDGGFFWHAKVFGDKLYGTAYISRDGEYAVSLYTSSDAVNWKRVADFPVPGNETYLDFDREGLLWALVRDDNRGCIPTLCVAEPPYLSFRSVMRLPMRLQGPMMKRLDGGCVIICRQWDEPGRRNLRTDLFWIEDGRELRRVQTLPSGGDTSYVGWLDLDKGRAVISYYSSHEHKMDEPHANNAVLAHDQAHAEHSTPADIFLADVSYA